MTEASKHSGKTLAYHGVSWEETCGYAQAVQVKDVIYVSGQLSHYEEGNLVGPAPTDASGRISTDTSNMEVQMRTTYVKDMKRTLRLVIGETGERTLGADEARYNVDLHGGPPDRRHVRAVPALLRGAVSA